MTIGELKETLFLYESNVQDCIDVLNELIELSKQIERYIDHTYEDEDEDDTVPPETVNIIEKINKKAGKLYDDMEIYF